MGRGGCTLQMYENHKNVCLQKGLEAKCLLLDDSQTYATEPLLQVLDTDALRVWAASYQTQHLQRGTMKYQNMRAHTHTHTHTHTLKL